MTPLTPGIIDILHFRLDTPWPGRRPMVALLTDAERERIGRLGLDLLRRRATLSRAWLRSVLGTIRGEAPERVPIELAPGGKPFSPGGPAFNISHSEDRLVIALAIEGEIGVDIEMIRPLEDLDNLASLVFSPRELHQLQSLHIAARLPAFYRGWTRKEALIKAVGKGLSMPLEQFSVALEESCDDCLRECHVPGIDSAEWHILSVACESVQTLAVASNSPVRGVRVRHQAQSEQVTL